MTLYYDRTTNGFLHRDHHKIPKGAVEVSEGRWKVLLAGQSAGKKITADQEGRPVLVDQVPAAVDDWHMVRLHRNHLLSITDWTQLPDVPSKTRTRYAAYRQKLRDLPQRFARAGLVEWPEVV